MWRTEVAESTWWWWWKKRSEFFHMMTLNVWQHTFMTNARHLKPLPCCRALKIIWFDVLKLHFHNLVARHHPPQGNTLNDDTARGACFNKVWDVCSHICCVLTPYVSIQRLVVVEVVNLVVVCEVQLSEMFFDFMKSLENQCIKSCIKSLTQMRILNKYAALTSRVGCILFPCSMHVAFELWFQPPSGSLWVEVSALRFWNNFGSKWTS